MKKGLLLTFQLTIIGCSTYFVHELVHLFAHLSLGHTVDFKINHIDLLLPKTILIPWQQAWVSGSGALFTFLQGIIAYQLLKKSSSMLWFNVLLSAFSLRFAAMILGFTASSDEIKASIALGLPAFFLTVGVMIGFLFLLYRAKKQQNYSTKTILIHFVVMLGITYLFSLI